MKGKRGFSLTGLAVIVLVVALLAATGLVGAQGGAPTVVSYQGQVVVDGAAYSGAGYFKFAVVDGAGTTTYWSNDGTSSGGIEPGSAVTLTVTSGLLTVLLGDTSLGNMDPLPTSAFSDTDRMLRVWFSSDGLAFTQLTPDRRIAAVPYALQAQEAAYAAAAGNAAMADYATAAGDADTLDGQHASAFASAGSGWALTGNSGTDPAASFVGTTDNVTFTVRAHNAPVLQIVPNVTSPNLIGGYGGNWVTAGVFGAVIGGGGQSDNLNRVTDHLGAIGGGQNNQAGNNDTNLGNAHFATIAGGWNNTASGPSSAIGGGYTNVASGSAATVPGGALNVASGRLSLAAGKGAHAVHEGAFVWADASTGVYTSTVENQFAVRATGGVTFTTGSAPFQVNGNTVWHAGNDGAGSTLDADLLDGLHAGQLPYWSLTGNSGTDPAADFVGTTDNVTFTVRVNNAPALRIVPDATSPNLIAGHSGNSVAPGVYGAVIAGGGESDDWVSLNRVTDDLGTVGGGKDNQAGYLSTVSGGASNTASGSIATVSGGGKNTAGGLYSTVGGGQSNTAGTDLGSTVGGGVYNTAGNRYATVGGGAYNRATGISATIPGGHTSVASGDYSTAIGGQAAATHYGELAQASGWFTLDYENPGQAQTSVYVMRRAATMTAGTWHDLYLDGSGALLTVAIGRTVTFEILITAATADGESAGYRIEGLVENAGGTTALVGTPTVTTLGEDDPAWDAQAIADDTGDALHIQVQGNGEEIRWVARVTTAEVRW